MPPGRVMRATSQENRFYFSQGSALVELDRQLLAKAGVESQNRVIVYFVPADAERQIMLAERDFAQRAPEEILQPNFGVRAAGDGYEFYVTGQQPGKGPTSPSSRAPWRRLSRPRKINVSSPFALSEIFRAGLTSTVRGSLFRLAMRVRSTVSPEASSPVMSSWR